MLVLGILLNSFSKQVLASSFSTTVVSTPVGTPNSAPVTFFIPFEGYPGGQPTSAIITDTEVRGDLDHRGEFIYMKVSGDKDATMLILCD